MILPKIALSVRQPWAWAIIYAGKDIENRGWLPGSSNRSRMRIGHRVCIHAASGMTQHEYRYGAAFINEIIHPGRCPEPHELVRGAIIGSVMVQGGVTKHNANSPWWIGPFGIGLEHPEPLLTPIRAKGDLGWFDWTELHEPPIPPMKWMLPKDAVIEPVKQETLL